MANLIQALETGNVNQAKSIIKKIDVNASIFPPNHEYGHFPPLIAISESGNVELVRLTLDRGANVNGGVGVNGISGLYIASQNGFYEMASLFIARGAHVNLATRGDNTTPLHISTQFGHKKIIKLLIDNGANVNAVKSDDGNTPLHIALKTGNEMIAKLLIDSGAEVTKKNGCGTTPLMIAANRGFESLVRHFIAAGEDPTDEDWEFGCSAVDFAALAGQTRITEILNSHIAEIRDRRGVIADEAEGAAEIVSGVKALAMLNVNIYQTPLQDHEISRTEVFAKEIKHKICDSPDCPAPNRAHGQKLNKCSKCRRVRYCSRECQTLHWKSHKKMCRKPVL